jgi:uncharacterized protein YndB with AHSA1/START domain
MALPIREGDIPGIQLRARRRLAIDRAESWRWLTERDRLERWLADRVEVDTGPRGGLRLERDSASGPLIETARSERFDPTRAWVLSFRRDDPRWQAATRLEITLLDADRGCDLDVLQSGFHLLAMSSSLTIWEEYRRRWRDALERLAERSG